MSAKTIRNAALGVLVGAGALVAAGAASADVACNRYGECWRVHEHYTTYPTRLGVIFHDDAWWDSHPRGHWHWRRDRDDDHGYWMHNRWHRFDRD